MRKGHKKLLSALLFGHPCFSSRNLIEKKNTDDKFLTNNKCTTQFKSEAADAHYKEHNVLTCSVALMLFSC